MVVPPFLEDGVFRLLLQMELSALVRFRAVRMEILAILADHEIFKGRPRESGDDVGRPPLPQENLPRSE